MGNIHGSSMKPLSVLESLRDEPLSQETVEEAFRNAVRSRELRDLELFQWWRARIETELEKHLKKLSRSEGTLAQINRRQGAIIGTETIFSKLDKSASMVEDLQERLGEYKK